MLVHHSDVLCICSWLATGSDVLGVDPGCTPSVVVVDLQRRATTGVHSRCLKLVVASLWILPSAGSLSRFDKANVALCRPAMLTSSPVSALSAVLLLAASVRGTSDLLQLCLVTVAWSFKLYLLCCFGTGQTSHIFTCRP